MYAEGPHIPLEAINHHAPPTPRSTPSTGLFKRASEFTGTFSRKTKKQKDNKPCLMCRRMKRDAKTPNPKPENLTQTPERKMGKRREREERKRETDLSYPKTDASQTRRALDFDTDCLKLFGISRLVACPCEEKGTEPKPQKAKPKPRTEPRAIQPRTRTRNLLL